jgi:hypothetical protein
MGRVQRLGGIKELQDLRHSRRINDLSTALCPYRCGRRNAGNNSGARSQPFSEFVARRPPHYLLHLANQVVRKRHAFQRGANPNLTV